MVFNQKLACLKLIGIHAVQQHPLSRLFSKILTIELRRHRTPYFSTLLKVESQAGGWNGMYLNVGDMAFCGKIPIDDK